MWSVAMLESKQILWDLKTVFTYTISVVPLNLHTIDNLSELHSTVVVLVMIKCRPQTMQTVQTEQAMQLLCLLFFKL